MANYDIYYPLNFNSELRMLTTSDPAHADIFNSLFSNLLNNETFLKSLTDLLMIHTHTGIHGGPSQINTDGISDGAITPIKLSLGGGFNISHDTLSGSLDFERQVRGIPYIFTETEFTNGSFNNMEIV